MEGRLRTAFSGKILCPRGKVNFARKQPAVLTLGKDLDREGAEEGRKSLRWSIDPRSLPLCLADHFSLSEIPVYPAISLCSMLPFNQKQPAVLTLGKEFDVLASGDASVSVKPIRRKLRDADRRSRPLLESRFSFCLEIGLVDKLEGSLLEEV